MSYAEEIADLSSQSPLILRQRLDRYLRTNDDRKLDAWRALRRAYLIQRGHIWRQCEIDMEYRAWVKALIYSEDGFWFFARTFGHVVEDRNPDGYRTEKGWLAFTPFIHQEWAAQFFFGCMEDSRQGLIVKTRDMGVSWMVMHMLAWLWLTRQDSFSAMLVNQSADLVEQNRFHPNTMFGRLENIIARLPEWLLPEGFNLDDKQQRQEMVWTNPENGNRFEGLTNTSGAGRARRATVAVGDEFEFWKQADQTIGALRESVGSLWLITTPNREGNQVARRIVEEGQTRVMDLPWEYHPHKTRQWYEEWSKEHLEENRAAELNLSWDGNKTDLIYPEYERVPKGNFPFRLDWPLYGGIDFGRSDGCGLVWVQRSPLSLRHRFVASYYNAGHLIDFYIPFMKAGARMTVAGDEYGGQDIELINLLNAWYRSGKYGIEWYGDPSGHQHTLNKNTSVIEDLNQHGIIVGTNARMNSHAERQDRARTVLRNAEVNNEHCAMLNWAMARYRKAPDKSLSTAVNMRRPRHVRRVGELATAVEYYAVNVPNEPIPGQQQTEDAGRHIAAWER